jgi:hypothetical protein
MSARRTDVIGGCIVVVLVGIVPFLVGLLLGWWLL